MLNEVEIKLRITESGIEIFDDAGKKMEAFDKSARRASGEDGGGGLKSFISGMADAKAAYDVFSQSIQQSAGLIDQVNQIGVVSLRAKAGYEALGGSADTIKRMQDATRGLVDDTLLYQDATHAMSSEAAKSADDLVKIAQIGATLGITFRGDAAAGVMEFTRAIEGVGNVRALRGLGIDVTAVKARLEELKGTMSDQDAWRMAIFEVAGENAKKLAGNLDSTGTSLERLKIKFDDFVEGQAENVATGLEAIVGWWTMLADNPSLTLTVTLNTANNAATSSLNNANDSLTDWLNSEARRLTGQPAKGEHTGEMFGPDKSFAPVTSSGNNALRWLNDAGQQQREDAYRASIGGDQAYWQRRNRASSYDRGTMGNESLRDEFVAPYEAAHKQATELATVKSILGDISGLASDYNSKMLAVIAPLQEQQRILEKRKAIQSIDDAFGTTEKDGLYGEIGSGMGDAIAQQRAAKEAELERTGRRYGKNSKKYKAAAADLEEFDQNAKDTMDEYAIATGAATKESIKFRDQVADANKAFAEGKISLSQYKNELLLLGEAAKQGITSMDQLTQIQRRLNLDMKPGAKSDADKSLFEQYAGGVHTGGAGGAAGEKATGPFDAVVVSANKASAAAADIGTKGAVAVGQLTIAGVLAAGSMGMLHGQTDNALQKVLKLQQQLNTLASLSINITTTPRGGSDNTTRPARGMR